MTDFRREAPNRSGGRNSGRPSRKDSYRSNSGYSGKRDSNRNKFDGRNSGQSEKTTVICSSCKKSCEVPFKPSSNRPVYCSDCFKKESGSNNNFRKDSGFKNNFRKDFNSKPIDYSKEFIEINKKIDKIMIALKIN